MAQGEKQERSRKGEDVSGKEERQREQIAEAKNNGRELEGERRKKGYNSFCKFLVGPPCLYIMPIHVWLCQSRQESYFPQDFQLHR